MELERVEMPQEGKKALRFVLYATSEAEKQTFFTQIRNLVNESKKKMFGGQRGNNSQSASLLHPNSSPILKVVQADAAQPAQPTSEVQPPPSQTQSSSALQPQPNSQQNVQSAVQTQSVSLPPTAPISQPQPVAGAENLVPPTSTLPPPQTTGK